VAFASGWDSFDKRTLHFLDADLEHAYQKAESADATKRAQATGLAAAATWVVLGIVGPPAIGVAPEKTWAIAAALTVFNLATAFAGRWATTYARGNAITLTQQLGTAVGVLLVTYVNGIFPTYALPALMLVAVGSFALARHPFVASVPLAIVYGVLFVLVAIEVNLGGQLPLQLFILASALGGGCAGAYLLERSSRTAFAQGTLATALHERVDQLLRQYVSPEVASTLIEDPRRSALGGEELEITVLFADLRGYTSFSERTAPAQVVAMLNDAFGVAVPIVLAEGGTVVQFMGDAMMAIFNAPHPQPDHALRAARAALALQRAIADLHTGTDSPGFRVGINSGPALVGNIGAAQMRNYSAIGDTTNLAARLQTFATEGSVVIGAMTFALIGDCATVRPLGHPELKGKSQPVEVYELLAVCETDSPMEIGPGASV
jgi:class 3 adenylate cyclase